jgi:hypothetical protein
MSLSYREIIKKSWQITWNNKILWFFGFFAMSLFSNSRTFNLIIDNLNNLSRQDLSTYYAFQSFKAALAPAQIITFFSGLKNLLLAKPLFFFTALLVCLIVLVIILFIVWLAITSQISLIRGAAEANDDKKIKLKKSILEAQTSFWLVLGLNVIKSIILIILFAVFIYPFIAYPSFFSDATTIAFLIFFLVFIPLSVILNFTIIYASSFVVLKKEKVRTAISSAWILFCKNWLLSLEIGLLLLLIDFLAALALVVFMTLLAIPFGLLLVIFSFVASDLGLKLVSVLIICASILAVIFFTALISTFQYATWTILFLKLAGKSAKSKTTETLSALSSYFKK